MTRKEQKKEQKHLFQCEWCNYEFEFFGDEEEVNTMKCPKCNEGDFEDESLLAW